MTIPITQITPTGPVVPAYDDVYNAAVTDFQSIFGSDAYIDPDSQDGQFIAIFALAIHNCNQALAAIYYQFSPQTAVGVGLDSVVKVNGIRREVATFSTAPVDLIGQPNTPINNGVVGDDLNLGTKWSVPAGTTIPGGGSITVNVTSLTAGAVSVPAGHINRIVSGATAGWQSVANSGVPTPGAPVESDLALRQRQAVSTALPALTPLAAIVAAIATLPGVIRVQPYENDTDTWDSNGLPEHSISMVVEGGVIASVAGAIAAKKNPGTSTYGTTSTVVIDPAGVANTINYMQLTLVEVKVIINIRALTNFASSTEALIQSAVARFITDLNIGEVSYVSNIYAPARLSGDEATLATGFTQPQLDVLAATYMVASIQQSRAPVQITTATGGPYAAGTTTISVADNSHFYKGLAVSVTLDDSSILSTTISAIPTGQITLAAAIPAGRQILTGAGITGVKNSVTTEATGGPYAAGVSVVAVADVSKLYVGCPIQWVLDDLSLLTTTVTNITGFNVTFANVIPVGRQILTNGFLFMTSDISCAFFEAGFAQISDITVNVA